MLFVAAGLMVVIAAGLMVVASAAGRSQVGADDSPPPPPAPPAQPTKTKVGMKFGEPRVIGRIKITGSPYTYFHVVACNPSEAGSCNWKDPKSDIRRAAKAFCRARGTNEAPSHDKLSRRVGGPEAGFYGEDAARRATRRTTTDGEPSVIYEGRARGFVSRQAGVTVFASVSCSNVVPIETVSNGCGGEGYTSGVQNYFGNTSSYRNSNNPLVSARSFTVNFEPACDLHDAGYSGAMVRDTLRPGNKLIDFSNWTRRRVDKKFLADMRILCQRQIPARFNVALRKCLRTGGPLSWGAASRFNLVRKKGAAYFDADPTQPGTQKKGPRANN